MRWSKDPAKGRGSLRRAGLLLAALVALLLASPAAEEPRLHVFAVNARYQVAIVERGGTEYVGLVELLQPLGPFEGRVDGKKFKFRFKGIEAEFQEGKTQARIGKLKI